MAKTLDEIQIDRLHDLLRRAERERDTESAAALRYRGGDPRLIVLFVLLLPLMVIWETAKKS